jgi:tetratricopeptide (TPR) repeat protein
MKRTVPIILCVFALCFTAYSFYYYTKPADPTLDAGKTATEAASQTPFKQIALARTLDVDAMAARMKEHQDVYKRLRDASLKAYAARHPPGRFDTINAQQIRMAAYLWTWGDFYGEGLWQAYADNVNPEPEQNDPLVSCVRSIGYYRDFYIKYDSWTDKIKATVERIENSDYPPEFKLWAWLHMTNVICVSGLDADAKAGMTQSFAMLPDLVRKTAASYRALIKEGLPDDLLAIKGIACIEDVSNNTSALNIMGKELDKAFEAEAPDSPVRAIVQGESYIKSAWNARGNGFADTVTDLGWQLMRERLQKASDILEAAYAKYPDHALISWCMLTVELGQGQGRPRMETWFQRAIKANPDYYDAYRSKEEYLMPRWYGTPEDLWVFGLECAESQNWQGKTPMILTEVANELSTQNAAIFSDPGTWNPLEKVFRAWLAHYPQSTGYRSLFVKFAITGKHWAVVKEQCAILGNNWDRKVMKGIDYPLMVKMAGDETRGK